MFISERTHGQISITNSSPVTQNFDGIGSGATATLPTNWKMTAAGTPSPSWSAANNVTATTQAASSGAPATGGRYNWGNGTTTTDRAIGFMTSGSYASPNSIMVEYENNTGGTITALAIAFDIERYRINSAAAAVTFFTSNDGITWIENADGASGAFPTGTSSYNFSTGTVVSKSFNIVGLSIADASKFYLRWNFNTTGGSSQGLGLDNVSLTATFSSANPTIVLAAPSQTSASNVSQGSLNHILSQFEVAVTDDDATLNSLAFRSAGTYTAASDLSNYRLWYNSSNSFGTATNISTVASGVASGNTVTFSSLNRSILENATGYFWITANVAAGATAGNTIIAENQVLTFASGNVSGSIANGGAQTIQAVTPEIVLSSPNPAIAAGTFNQNSTNNVVYRFDMAVSVANTALTAFDITTTGNYAANAVSNLKAWYSTDATFNAGSDVLLATIAAPGTAGVKAFSGFNQLLTSGNNHFVFVTVDVSCNAANGATLGVDAIETTDITTTANKTGSAFASGTHSFQEISPANVTALNAAVANQSLNVSWTNPTGCFSEVLIVAKAGSSISGTPTGDGSAFTADLNFGGAGTAFDGGKVIYKGTASPQTITGLTNGTTYFVRIFSRNGESWSAGSEVSATPAIVLTENFESGTKAAYTTGNVTLSSGSWTFNDALIGNIANDKKNGLQSARVRNFIEMNFNFTDGAGKVSFAYAHYGTDAVSTVRLFKSTNNGTSWTQVGPDFTTTGSLQTAEINVNESDPVRFRISRTGGDRVNIDDFQILGISTNTWNGTSWSAGQAPQGENAVIAGNLNIATGFTANNLTINNGAAVTLAAGEKVTVNGDFTNNGTLTLEATDEDTYAQLITNGTATGNVTVQRAITGSTAGWRFISPAVGGTLANLGNSVQLTGSANVIRLNTSNPNAWVAQGGASSAAFEAGKSYVAYFGNAGVNGSNVATTLSFTGTLNNSNVTVPGLSDGDASSVYGWSLAGNPFAAGIDFSNTTEVALTNIDPVYYIWRPEAGNYATWHRSSGSTPNGVLNGIIAPMQGFLVKTNNTSPVLTINRAARTTASNGVQFRTASITDRLYITVRHTGDNRSDEALLAAAPTATQNFESDFDALKAGSMSANAYSISTRSADGKFLAINAIPAFDATTSVPVRISGNQPGAMVLEVNLNEVSSTAPIILEDLYLNRTHDLRSGAYSYAHIPAQADRFVIHFTPLATSVAATSLDQVQVYTFNGQLFIRGLEQADQLRITDMTGRVVYSSSAVQLSGEGMSLSLATGNYLVQLVSKQGVKTAKVQF